AGDIASRTVISRLSAVADMSSAFAFRRAVRNALFKANGDLQALANNEFLDTVGSTVVALIAHGGHYACTWAGDSRAYILRDATLTRITTDHSVAQQLVDAGAESEAGARSRQDASIITRAVGACSKLELDGVYGRIQQGDRFLLCSDGLVAAISEAEIAADLGRTPTAYAASRLVDLALKHGVSDNVTAIVVEAAAG
ncbi:MAG: serine/threonine-protein phosphatase, partial [Burkholderiales bacterium]